MIKKNFVFIFVLMIITTDLIFSGDFLRVNYKKQSLAYNESKYFTIEIENQFTESIEDISIIVLDDDVFKVEILDENDFSLFPKEDYTVGINIVSEKKTLFTESRSILLEIETDKKNIQKRVYINIIAAPYIWPIWGILLGTIMIMVIIFVYRKLEKGESRD
ncbi:MAG: hypothetical protein OCD02_10310 [Spirochaetaceae bacterium]